MLENMIYAKHCLGKDGTPIKVFKFRTMTREADKDLSKVLANGLDNFGKPIDDNRITELGKMLRKYWLDELPQVYNVAKGEMSLVGIRPRREIDWQEFPEKHRKRALKYKPGFMGTPYAKKTNNFNDMVQSESEYLDERELHPITTQLKYFFLICYNILFRGARGK